MNLGEFASPIELLMARALAARSMDRYRGLRFIEEFGVEYEDCHTVAKRMLVEKSSGAIVYPHVKIGPYELDFLFLFKNRSGAVQAVAVECDGHEFHEKTPKQAAHDRKRDRYIALHSIPVLRFTGSEISRDAYACAEEAHRAILFIQNGPRSKVWLGYLSDDETDERQHQEYLQAMRVRERGETSTLATVAHRRSAAGAVLEDLIAREGSADFAEDEAHRAALAAARRSYLEADRAYQKIARCCTAAQLVSAGVVEDL